VFITVNIVDVHGRGNQSGCDIVLTSRRELRVEYKPLTTGPKGRRPSRRPSSERARTMIEADKVGEVDQVAERSVDS
jgi:hypothetical protein